MPLLYIGAKLQVTKSFLHYLVTTIVFKSSRFSPLRSISFISVSHRKPDLTLENKEVKKFGTYLNT